MAGGVEVSTAFSVKMNRLNKSRKIASQRETDMPHYIILTNWTDQGIRNINATPGRVESAKALARELGGKADVYYTFGEYDTVMMLEAPSDEAAMQVVLRLGKLGNIRMKTLKAFTSEEAARIIEKIPK